jgi:hypothetical protein
MHTIFLAGKSEGKRQLGISRYRWKDNIRMDLMKIAGKVWIGFIWLRIGASGRIL